MNTTIVEGPIEHHKSRLAWRETGDGSLAYMMGEAWTGPKRGRNRRAIVRVPAWGKSFDGTRQCARDALTFPMSPFAPEVDIDFLLLYGFLYRLQSTAVVLC